MEFTTLISSILLGFALAATCGFRIFLPLLGVCLAARFHLISLQLDFYWLCSNTTLICFTFMAILELLAWHIRLFEAVLPILLLPLAIVAGGLVATSVLPMHEPVIRWGLGLLGGGIAAGSVHSFKFMLRLIASEPTAAAGNRPSIKFENAAALAGTLMGIFIPVVAGLLAIPLVSWLLIKLHHRFFRS